MVKLFNITRTRLVTERFRVTAEDEQEALDILADEMFLPQQTGNCECMDESTEHSELEWGPTEPVEVF